MHTHLHRITPPSAHRDRGRDLVALAGFAFAVTLVAVAGGRITSGTVDSAWFDALDLPSWYPPSATFGIVWTILYVGIAVAGWRAWRASADRLTMGLWWVQLALNLGWTAVFFGARRPGWAVAEILVLLLVVAWTTRRLWTVDRIAGTLFGPYLTWVGFATALTVAIAAEGP
jgi:benzodiazapine receptor